LEDKLCLNSTALSDSIIPAQKRRIPVAKGFGCIWPEVVANRSLSNLLRFNTAIDMNRPLSVLVIAERLQRQRLQQGHLFGEYGRQLPVGAAIDACVGPVLFPVIEIRLHFFQALEVLAFKWGLLCMSDTDSTFPFRSGSRNLQGSAVTP
jgi:hypothetical protein